MIYVIEVVFGRKKFAWFEQLVESNLGPKVDWIIVAYPK